MKKLKNAESLLTQAGDEKMFEINTGSVFDFFREGFDEIKNGEVGRLQIIGWAVLLALTFFGGLVGWMYFL